MTRQTFHSCSEFCCHSPRTIQVSPFVLTISRVSDGSPTSVHSQSISFSAGSTFFFFLQQCSLFSISLLVNYFKTLTNSKLFSWPKFPASHPNRNPFLFFPLSFFHQSITSQSQFLLSSFYSKRKTRPPICLKVTEASKDIYITVKSL